MSVIRQSLTCLVTGICVCLGGQTATAEYSYQAPTGGEIKYQLTGEGFYSKKSFDEEIELEESIKGGSLAFNWYRTPRFEHPDVPFGFIPYNYRSSQFQVAGFYSKEDFTVTYGGGLTDTFGVKNYGLVLSQVQYAQSGFFSIAELQAQGIDGPQFRHSLAVFTARALIGGQNERVRGGAGLGVENQAENLIDAVRSGEESFSIIYVPLLFEITPSQFFRIAVLPEYAIPENGPSSYELPVDISGMLPENWIELRFRWTLADEEQGFASHKFNVQARKHFMQSSIFSELELSFFGRDQDRSTTFIGGGFDYVSRYSSQPIAFGALVGYQSESDYPTKNDNFAGFVLRGSISLFLRD